MNIQSTENILLLGAGFTKNFGGLLANEMWAEIFNHEKIQAQPRIKKLMLEDFDYESVYYSVLEGLYSKDEKNAMKEATKSAHKYIDDILIEHVKYHPFSNTLRNVTNIISRFTPQVQKIEGPDGKTTFIYPNDTYKSFIFTLNQDLFFERLYDPGHVNFLIPGINNNSEWFTTYFNKPLEESDYCKLPYEDELNYKDILLEGNYFLIKLHGSCNWTSFDGSDTMVIGRGKTKQIQKEPLLKYYFNLFDKVLSQDQRRLLVIGYGFGDEHINRIISKAVEEHGLKIYILSPESPNDFKKKLYGGSETIKDKINICQGESPKDLEHKLYGEFEKIKDKINIWQGISGYFQCIEILSVNSDINQAMKKHFEDVFFGKNG